VIVDALVKKPWVDTSRWLYDLHMVGKLIDYQMIGSTYTLGTGRDIDFAVLMPETFSLLDQPEWLGEGWVREGADHYEGGAFASHRKGDTNIIMMNDCDLYQKFLTAMEVCKMLKLQTRRERVLVCRIVRDGMSAEQADSITISGEHT
jgi:hypothetical protein